jgi:hypothetical protein
MKLLKNLSICLAMVLSLTSVASEVTVLELAKQVRANDHDMVKTKFNVNEKLGRAWVEVSLIEISDEEYDLADQLRLKVNGLTYDMNTQEIVYNNNGKNVVCAQMQTSRSWLGIKTSKLVNTGSCVIGYKNSEESYDDGFYITQRKIMTITLEIK